MKNFIIKTVLIVVTFVSLNAGVFVTPAFASAGASQQTACNTLKSINPNEGCGSGKVSGATGLDNVIRAVVNLLSVVVGIVSVIMIIIGGIKFVTSGGDSNAVASAKSTVIYALVGLLIVALAQTIVHVVLNVSTGTVETPPPLPKHK